MFRISVFQVPRSFLRAFLSNNILVTSIFQICVLDFFASTIYNPYVKDGVCRE